MEWTEVRDRHASANTDLGKVWIRTDREQANVTGVYTMFGKTKKLVPPDNEVWTVADGKVVAELALEDEIQFRKKLEELNS